MSKRAQQWDRLGRRWDLVVVGGGATGAAVLREAVRAGLSALLVEQRDFAWGTSSRSTKLAHGGLRYLDTGDLGLVRDSIRERDRLVRESDGLAAPLPFVMTSRRAAGLRHWKAVLGTKVYALLGRRWPRPLQDAAAVSRAVPGLQPASDQVFAPYDEASIDDARLVLRLVQEAQAAGGVALNQARVERLSRGPQDVELILADRLGGQTRAVRARAVVNATGVWADALHPGPKPALRRLRGSHLLFPRTRWPLQTAVSFRHPRDGRFVCAVPWEDSVVFGTTDLDHEGPLSQEPRVSQAEFDYLLEAAAQAFPGLGLTAADVVSSLAGVRAVLDEGPGAPSAASRGHLAREEDGVVTITGGKLTNCRQMARDALALLRGRLPALRTLRPDAPLFEEGPRSRPASVSEALWARLRGRYGARAPEVVACAWPGELESVGGTATVWAELRWALRHEQVHHLDDLLLRRVRVGLFLPRGAEAELPRVHDLCAQELGWGAHRWAEEAAAYRALWARHHAPFAPTLALPVPAHAA